MNTRFDHDAYDLGRGNCRRCNNPVVNPVFGDRPYCVRCNISLPDWMVKIKGRAAHAK